MDRTPRFSPRATYGGFTRKAAQVRVVIKRDLLASGATHSAKRLTSQRSTRWAWGCAADPTGGFPPAILAATRTYMRVKNDSSSSSKIYAAQDATGLTFETECVPSGTSTVAVADRKLIERALCHPCQQAIPICRRSLLRITQAQFIPQCIKSAKRHEGTAKRILSAESLFVHGARARPLTLLCHDLVIK